MSRSRFLISQAGGRPFILRKWADLNGIAAGAARAAAAFLWRRRGDVVARLRIDLVEEKQRRTKRTKLK
jgi:hypothetical protein